MAGAGQRFVDAGYLLPKPLIPVLGIPMAVRAARALPHADRWIFVCREQHVRESALDEVLRASFDPVTVLTVRQLTDGQARTCLVAVSELRPDDQITIGACDNGMSFKRDGLETLWREGADAIIWTFRGHRAVLENPAMYGWVSIDGNGSVLGVSCKVPISNDPISDHAVVGAFSFRRAVDLVWTIERTLSLNRRVNGEFYLDTVLDQAVAEGLRVRILEVDDYTCWGTPQALEAAERG